MESGDRNNMCRLCLLQCQSLIYIFEANDMYGYVAAGVIEDLLQLKVSRTDTYPQFICENCLDKLTEFRNFKNQCHNSKATYDNVFFPPESADAEEGCHDSVNYCTVKIEKEEMLSDEEPSYGVGLSPDNMGGEEDDDGEDRNYPYDVTGNPVKLEDEPPLNDGSVPCEVTITPIRMEHEGDMLEGNMPCEVSLGPIPLKQEMGVYHNSDMDTELKRQELMSKVCAAIKKRGRPKQDGPVVKPPPKWKNGKCSIANAIRKQDLGVHWPIFVPKRGRCVMCALKKTQSRPHSRCLVCKVYLCVNEKKNCFHEYHHI